MTGDTDDELDVYRRTPAGELVHVCDDPTGPDANVPAIFRRATDDRVFFETAESLADTDSDNADDVYGLGPDGLAHLTDGGSCASRFPSGRACGPWYAGRASSGCWTGPRGGTGVPLRVRFRIQGSVSRRTRSSPSSGEPRPSRLLVST